MALQLAQHPGVGGTLLQLSGTIDSNLPLRTVQPSPADSDVVLVDLCAVDRITSYGVREWIAAIQQLKGSYIGIIRARSVMLMQFNIVSGFFGRAELLSCYLPYVCEGCSEYFDTLVDVRAEHERLARCEPPDATCPKCKGVAEFDDVPRFFFSQVSKRPRPSPPRAVDELLRLAPAQ